METSFEIKLPGVLLIAPDMKMNFSLAEGKHLTMLKL